ncbi:MAG: hypothetical protein ABR925_03645 [Acidimicrobiales bacterium]|jgi:hypothetical protein
MTRKVLWPVLVIGIFLIVLPFAISMPSKTSDGQTMLNQFHPIMQPSSVNTAANYYYNTFVPLRTVAAEGLQATPEVPQLISGLALELKMTPAQVEQFLGADFPAMAKLLMGLPHLTKVFSNVSPGLSAYKPNLIAMQNNVHNYAQIDSMPSMNLLTWFFVVPGALLVLLAGLGLAAPAAFRRRSTP